MENAINNWGEIAGSISAIFALLALILFNPIKKRIAKVKKEKQDAAEFRKLVLKKLDLMIDDIADLQYERLTQAHDFYTTQGWCPPSKKEQLCVMHESYSNKGRNHLQVHYKDDILNLKDKPE